MRVGASVDLVDGPRVVWTGGHVFEVTAGGAWTRWPGGDHWFPSSRLRAQL
jgi:hypothetical protein